MLEILWGRLVTVMDEVDAATVRTAFSTVLAEGRDFACILLDVQGRSIAQGTFSTTGFVVTLPRTAKQLLKKFPPAELSPGDMLATNDPWMGSGHLPDFSFLSPVFRGGKLIGYIGTVAHLTDAGGRLGYFNGVDVYEEGIRLPPCRLFDKGVANTTAFSILGANVRASRLVLGDIEAIAATHQLGATRLLQLLDEYALPDLRDLADRILTLSSASMEQAIAQIPDGEYRGEMLCDGYGDPVTLRVALRAGGGRLSVDFAGSSPQTTRAAINAVISLTIADTLFALKCALIPDIRNNEGLSWPIDVDAPAGSILNASFPVAVQARSKTSMHVHQAIFAALAEALPGRVQAGSAAAWPISASGIDAAGARFATHFFLHGGKGATARSDGLATTAFPYNAAAGSVEIYENSAPLLVERKALRVDSGGPGRHRGGLGQEMVVTSRSPNPVVVWVRPDKIRFPPIGLAGGRPGRSAEFSVKGEAPNLPTSYELLRGESVVVAPPGGGGYGDPFDRDPVAVAADVAEGYVSLDSAAREYGVMLDDAGRPDGEQTVRARDRLRSEVHDSGRRPVGA